MPFTLYTFSFERLLLRFATLLFYLFGFGVFLLPVFLLLSLHRLFMTLLLTYILEDLVEVFLLGFIFVLALFTVIHIILFG
jgi:hypothetical protein